MLGFVHNNKQLIVGFIIGTVVSIVFHLSNLQSFSVGVAMGVVGAVLDRLDGKV